MIETAERVAYRGVADNYVFNRQLRAYEVTQDSINGTVLEVGSGQGYGLKLLSPKADRYIALDKFDTPLDQQSYPNVEFVKATVPPISGIQSDSIDFVVSFQLIEHIEDDKALIKEIKRVLKPGGKLIMTTPNIKTTLSRNPWHVREYTKEEFRTLLSTAFEKVEVKGIYGDDVVLEYYEENKRSVQKIMKYDIFNLQYRLPRRVLQVPFDVLNQRNRKKLSKSNSTLLDQIQTINFFLDEVSDECLDLYAIATA